MPPSWYSAIHDVNLLRSVPRREEGGSARRQVDGSVRGSLSRRVYEFEPQSEMDEGECMLTLLSIHGQFLDEAFKQVVHDGRARKEC